MNILFIPGYYFPSSEDEIVSSGDLRYSINLAIGLSNLGHKVTILNKKYDRYKNHIKQDHKYRGLEFYSYKNGLHKVFTSSFDISISRLYAFKKLLKNTDLIISNTPLSLELPLIFFSKKKYIYNVSGLYDKKNYSFSIKQLALFLFVVLIRDNLKKINFRLAHKVNTSSSYEVKLLQKLKVSKNKIISISSGYDERYYYPPHSLEEKFSTLDKERTILHVSRLTPAKGVLETIDAFSRLNPKKYQLIIVGNDLSHDSKYKQEVIDRTKDIDNVELLINMTERNLPEYFRKADLFSSFSKDYDPLPTVIIESLSSGTPVISSYYKSREQFIDDGINGIFVDKLDIEKWVLEVKKYFNENMNRQTLIKNAIKNSKPFSNKFLASEFLLKIK
jgi:glycosyltransferase involved in cell wall biosynthesis